MYTKTQTEESDTLYVNSKDNSVFGHQPTKNNEKNISSKGDKEINGQYKHNERQTH